jgi:hypothetical protein
VIDDGRIIHRWATEITSALAYTAQREPFSDFMIASLGIKLILLGSASKLFQIDHTGDDITPVRCSGRRCVVDFSQATTPRAEDRANH